MSAIVRICLALSCLVAVAAAPPAPRRDRQGEPLPRGAVARLGTPWRLHPAPIEAIAYSPDGKRLVAASAWHLSAWDTSAGKLLHRVELSGKFGRVVQLAISPDSRLAAVVCDERLRVVDLDAGRESYRLSPNAGLWQAVSFSPGGKRFVAAGTDRRAYLFDAKSGEKLRTFPKFDDGVLATGFADAGRSVCAFTRDKRGAVGCRTWDAASGDERKLWRANGSATALAVAADVRSLALLLKDDPHVQIRSELTGELVREIDLGAAPTRLALSADGRLLAALSANTVHVRATSGDRPPIKVRVLYAACVGLAPDGKSFAVGIGPRARSYDLAGNETHPPRCPSDGLGPAFFLPNGTDVLTSDSDGIRRWDALTGARTGFQPLAGKLLAVAPGGEMIVHRSNILSFRKFGAEKPAREWQADAPTFEAVPAPGGRLLATGHGGPSLCLWDVVSGKQVGGFALPRVQGKARPLLAPGGFSPDGRMLVFSGEGIVGSLDVTTGKQTRRIAVSDHFPPISRDGRFLVERRREPNGRGPQLFEVYLWRIDGGKPPTIPLGTKATGVGLAFSDDGRYLAACFDLPESRRFAIIYETASSEECFRFTGHEGGNASRTFSPDGRLLVTQGDAGTLLAWDVTGRAPDGRLKAVRATPPELESWWAHLIADAPRAHRATWALVASGNRAVALLGGKLRRARKMADPSRVRRLIADLDAEDAASRDDATQALEVMGIDAQDALSQTLARKPSAEARRRIERLLSRLGGPLSGEPLREARAIHVLEQVGTPEARTLLRRIEGEAAGTALGREANAALLRASRRKPLDVAPEKR